MIYIQIRFKLNPDTTENREILVAMLSDLAFESFDESEEQIMGYIPGESVDLEEIEAITTLLPFSVATENEMIPDKNWNEVWEKNYFKPLLIGNRCLVRAPFHTEFEPAEFELVIEPKMAFGTGNHETTTLIAEQILNMDLAGKTVLDMGCGTGILGMLASLKGAKTVTAIDIDTWSFESTVENARLNNILNLEAKLGDASLLGTETFEIIFANIHKNVIVNDLPVYESVLQSGGKLYLSGFYTYDMPDVKAKAESLGLIETGFQEKNNWVVYAFSKL
ncbi:ribosomal protein L11 methyltransferase [Aquipluma nitroreducens]|uniref:Ribosomal protein L11 methyltransferase n=1 Tax=Aquipluma nitroreducens TaxID=2010828 RepID=A0A5K7SGD4_9BACT|nr:50S ribosomal protein L11 methyltransferase [Aquipluma nitroreducens]BBE20603.1 ribosomal protein L11 methyltransferase [Aquipluma nitroreducens]